MTEPGPHLDDQALVELIEGRADPAVHARALAHAADCASCRELLSALARQVTPVIASAPTLPQGDAVPPPAQVGRYVLTKLLGAGGMGMVFAARDPELDRTVAVKLLRASSDDEMMQQRLRREGQAMAKVSHPNVVAVYDVGTLGDRMFVAMEYVEGETLARWLATPRPLADILDKFTAAGRGLAAAHAQGIVHRDFKPENVLVGDDGRVRVVDFGIAKSSGSARSDAARPLGLTATNAAVGTPFYMAPEQYLAEPVDGRTDQFSFCVALYAAVHGVRPFTGDTLDALAAAALAGRITAPAQPQRVPERIQRAIVRGLAAKPADRFPTIDALLGELVVAPRRRLALAIAGGVVAAGAITATLAYAARPGPSPPPPLAAPSHDFTLPAIGDVTRAAGPALTPSHVEAAAPEQLGQLIVGATWCAPRNLAVLLTAYGQIVTLDRGGTVTTLARVTPVRTSTSNAVACLATGRIVGVLRGAPFAIDGSTAIATGTPPPDVVDAVALGTTARWIAAGKLWAWSGDGEPQLVRTACPHPLRLSPDGARVACVHDQRIAVDDGTTTVEGPVGTSASWAHDGRALYTGSGGVVRRWTLGGGRDGDLVTTGITPTEVGPWLVAKNGPELALAWIGPGKPRKLAPIDLDPGGARTRIVAALGRDAVVVAYAAQSVRVVPLETPAPPVPRDRHFSTVATLAFSADGNALVTAGGDRRLITHGAERQLLAELPDAPGAETIMVWRSDGSLVIGGHTSGVRGSGSWDAAGTFTAWPLAGMTGPIDGTDDLVHLAIRDGLQLVNHDGTLGTTLLPGPLPRGLAGAEIDRARRFALVRAASDLAQLVDLATGKVVFGVTIRGNTAQLVALAPGGTIVIADTSGQVWAASERGVVPLLKVPEPITALAVSPATRRFAIGAGRSVVVYDLDRDAELGRGAIDSTATALAWSRDGARLAAAAASTQLTTWTIDRR